MLNKPDVNNDGVSAPLPTSPAPKPPRYPEPTSAVEPEFDPTMMVGIHAEGYRGKATAVEVVVEALISQQLRREEITLLQMHIPSIDEDTGAYGASFDMLKEINQQMLIVRGLRNEVFTAGGRIRTGYEFKDANTVLKACDGMIKTMMVQHEKLVNVSRFQKIETAVHAAIDKLDPESRSMFIQEMNTQLNKTLDT